MSEQLTEQFKRCRRAGVPLVAVETSDPAESCRLLVEATNGKGSTAVIRWDLVRTAVGLTESGAEWVEQVCQGQDARIALSNPVEFLTSLTGSSPVPRRAVIILLGADRLLAEAGAPFSQAVWNLRDLLKAEEVAATLVMLGPLGFKLPPSLAGDIVALTDPLPGEEQLEQLAVSLYETATSEQPTVETSSRMVERVAGLSAFAAEQVIAMSLSNSGVDLEQLWARKKSMIEQTPGLSVYSGGESFATIGGYVIVKSFMQRILSGRRRPRCILFLDEIEKALGGAGTDTSGVSTSFLGTLLSWTQDRGVAGLGFMGPPGSGKSAVAKASGQLAGIPTISFDLSGMKASLVGESEARLRAALAVVDAVGQGQVMLVATCNSQASLPPEMRRRFNLGWFWFDLPSDEERAQIWGVYSLQYPNLDFAQLPADQGWTGAEIKQCCDVADRLGSTLLEAASFVVPVSRQSADKIEELRRQASGRFLSASYPGVYRMDKPDIRTVTATTSRRAMEV